MEVTSLKEKLNIRDFACRGSASDVPDVCESYYLTAKSLQEGFGAKMTESLKAQGIDKESLMALLSADDKLIESLFTNTAEIADTFDDKEFGEEYQKNKANIEKIKAVLEKDKSLPQEKKKTLESELKEAETQLAIFKQNKLKEKVEIDPQVILNNPKALRALVNLISKETRVEKIEIDKDGVLNSIKDEIISKFMLGKKEEHELFDYGPVNKYLFSKADFFELLREISREPENMMTQDSQDFFTDMRS